MNAIKYGVVCTILLMLSGLIPVAAELNADAPTILITGSNRGLGLEFSRQYAGQGWNVIATCRTPEKADELQALAAENAQVVIEKLDVTSDADVDAVAEKYRNQPIDVLLNNAGIYGTLEKQTLGNFDFDELRRIFEVNTIGPLRVSQAFLANVEASDQKKIISLGGGLGTPKIAGLFPGHYFMKMSKAAHLNAMSSMQGELKKTGIMIVAISPGQVNTQLMQDSGWTGKSISAEESARRVIPIIAALEPEMKGRLVGLNGEVMPW